VPKIDALGSPGNARSKVSAITNFGNRRGVLKPPQGLGEGTGDPLLEVFFHPVLVAASRA
jgi:hypothetical protein